MPSPLRDAFGALFSRLFPKTLEVDINLDTAPSGTRVYVDAVIKSKDGSYRITDLKGVPSRIKIGSRQFRVSNKNRQTLRHLADWDPAFDSRKGFVFYEKDVPDILSYLRSKASLRASTEANKIIVDETRLEYAHEIQGSPQDIEIKTKLTHPDSQVEISDESQVKGLEGSKFVHVGSDFFGKPEVTAFKTFEPRIGTTRLSNQQIPLFLLYDLKRIQGNSRNHVSQGVAAQEVITSPFEPKVSLHVDGPWIWFDVRYQAEKFSIPYQRVEATKANEQFIREEDTWIQVDKAKHSDVAEHIRGIPEVEKVEDGFRTPTRHFYEVQSLLEQVAKIDSSEAYKRFLKSLDDFSQIEEPSLPEGFLGDLRDYQKHGYAWLWFLHKYGLNGILADEMGLGKTAQTLVMLLEAHSFSDARTSLIVCPPSVLSAWDDDMNKFTSVVNFRTSRYVGSNRRRILATLNQYDAVLTTYAIVARDIDALSQVAWEYVILDEAQKIKNNDTATAKACKRLVANHKLALTGTPIENRLSELWSIYDFLMPSYLGGYTNFRDKFEVPIMKHADRKATEDLKRRINPFKLRRLKSQVAKELPEKIMMERYCELTPEQVQLYKQYASAEREKIKNLPDAKVRIDTSILTAILRLKQICCHPALVTKDKTDIYGRSGKLDAFLEIIDELVENGEKALIFSQFTEMLGILRKAPDDKKLSYFYLDGATPEKSRAQMKNDFQRGAVPFFLISLRAGGLGMTLTEANCVVHYDRWWNPAVEDQATDRVHRIGQEKPVKVFRIHTTGTIEERIGQLLIKKKDLFDTVIEVDDLRKEISKDELLALFAPLNQS
jgi:SNF2-related domain/Helicase conserved C-terminal domain